MKTRILTGIIGGLLFLYFLLKGGILLVLAIGFLVALGTWEFSRLVQATGIKNNYPLMLTINLLFLLGQAVNIYYNLSLGCCGLIGLFLVFVLLFSFFSDYKNGISETSLISTFANLFTLVYPGILFTYILLVRAFPEPYGWEILIFSFLVIWGNDTGAYFIGSAWGKTPLIPRISPNKTVEGAVGGLIVGMIIGTIFGLVRNLPLGWLVGTCLVAGIIGQLGDIFESFLKRSAEIKDSGSFLPGHGGVLDRFDSTLFALPIIYYFALLIIP